MIRKFLQENKLLSSKFSEIMTESQTLAHIHVFIYTLCNVLFTKDVMEFCQTGYIEWRCAGKLFQMYIQVWTNCLVIKVKLLVAWGKMAIQQDENGCKNASFT